MSVLELRSVRNRLLMRSPSRHRRARATTRNRSLELRGALTLLETRRHDAGSVSDHASFSAAQARNPLPRSVRFVGHRLLARFPSGRGPIALNYFL